MNSEAREQIKSLSVVSPHFQAALCSFLESLLTFDTKGCIQAASDSIEMMFGWKPRELIGKDHSLLFPGAEGSKFKQFLKEFHDVGETSKLDQDLEFKAIRKDGTEFLVEISVYRMDPPGSDQPCFTGIYREVTEGRRIENELRLLNSIVLSIAEAKDLKSAMVTALEHVCTATGWEYGEAWLPDVSGEHLIDKPVWHSRQDPRGLYEAMANGARFRYREGLPGRVWASKKPEWLDDLTDKRVFCRTEQARRAGLKVGIAFPILAGKEVVAVLAFFMRAHRPEDQRLIDLVSAALAVLGPVVERRRIGDELERHHQQLETRFNERTRALEMSHAQLHQTDRLASLGTLAAGLGHDMNNILLPMRCRLETLAAGEFPDKSRGHLEALQQSIEYLQQLSDGLHMLSLDPNEQHASVNTTHLWKWWNQVGILLGKSLPGHVGLSVSLPKNLPPVAIAPHKLTQAVLNLIVNSGEAVSENGVIQIWAEFAGDESRIRLVVRDNGTGMTPKVIEHAMDPFFTTKRRGLGTGLGLSLVRGIVRSVGGSIDLNSEKGKGTSVTLLLPLVESDNRVDATLQGGELEQACITIDNPRIASLVSSILVETGFSVRTRMDDCPDECSIWVVDAHLTDVDEVNRMEKHGQRAVIVMGDQATNWNIVGADIIRNSNDFENIRKAIGDAVVLLRGGTP